MNEYHVSSLIVHATEQYVNEVKNNILAIEGTDIPSFDVAGKLIVLLEAFSRETLLDKYESIRGLPHVLATSLVYHQAEGQSFYSALEGNS